MNKIPFGPKPKIVDLTSDRKLADKVCVPYTPSSAPPVHCIMHQDAADSCITLCTTSCTTYAVCTLFSVRTQHLAMQISCTMKVEGSWTAICRQRNKETYAAAPGHVNLFFQRSHCIITQTERALQQALRPYKLCLSSNLPAACLPVFGMTQPLSCCLPGSGGLPAM